MFAPTSDTAPTPGAPPGAPPQPHGERSEQRVFDAWMVYHQARLQAWETCALQHERGQGHYVRSPERPRENPFFNPQTSRDSEVRAEALKVGEQGWQRALSEGARLVATACLGLLSQFQLRGGALASTLIARESQSVFLAVDVLSLSRMCAARAGRGYRHLSRDIASDMCMEAIDAIERWDPSRASLRTWLCQRWARVLTDYRRQMVDRQTSHASDHYHQVHDPWRTFEEMLTMLSIAERLPKRRRERAHAILVEIGDTRDPRDTCVIRRSSSEEYTAKYGDDSASFRSW